MPRRWREQQWYSTTSIHDLFFSKIEPWEAEEIFSVQTYMELLLTRTMHDTERRIKVVVRSIAIDDSYLDVFSSPTSSQDPAPKNPHDPEIKKLSIRNSPKLAIFFRHRKADWGVRVEEIASLGLDYMFTFARHDRGTRYKMLQNRCFWYREVITYGKPFEHRFHGSPPVTGSAGFLRYAESYFLDGPFSTLERCMRPFRAISLVFWDSSRITVPPPPPPGRGVGGQRTMLLAAV